MKGESQMPSAGALPALPPVSAHTLRADIERHLLYTFGKDPAHAVLSDWRKALSMAVRDRMIVPWIMATQRTYASDAKRVYYLSMEFLIGRLLEDAIINLDLHDLARDALAMLGQDLSEVIADEPDAALGNGGLGRLAACFLDSLATIGCPAMGYGIRYEHGLFRQRFEGGQQVEEPETWLLRHNPWEFQRPEATMQIGFGGTVEHRDGRAEWHPGECLVAAAYDTPVIGWQGRWGNTLRLWAAQPTEVLDLVRFNAGDYAGAAEREALARSLSRVLYPDDTTEGGKALRLKQEYFFTAASLADILRRFDSQFADIRALPARVAIQLNDTHPAIAGPELVRQFHDLRGLAFDEAMDLAQATLSYTNHTLLPEALEHWSEGLMGALLPRHMELIARIDETHARRNPDRRRAIREHGNVGMGTLAFVMAHRVNGVSALHTELMKSTVFAELDRLHPDRIVNQTNGVTPRRWLKASNPRLSRLITESIGAGWEDDLGRLGGLAPLAGDAGFQADFRAAKRVNKETLAALVRSQLDLAVSPDALFDVQIKRIHEYKRQHLNILEAVAHWQAIHDDPNAGWVPRLRLFAGKAAPGYWLAKEIIHLINDVARVVNADPVTRDRLQIAFLPNYNVSLAEKIIPAADLSEQISTAGKEASGTGNMKMALNGAVTIGTLDGANVEIRERVGAENFFLFGLEADEVRERRSRHGHAEAAIAADPALARALAAVSTGAFSDGDSERYRGIADNLRYSDYFLVCSDYTAYSAAQRAVDSAYGDPARWTRMAVLNTAHSGWFSSDRTIRGYMRDIWGARSAL